jgi:hypothetical protein
MGYRGESRSGSGREGRPLPPRAGGQVPGQAPSARVLGDRSRDRAATRPPAQDDPPPGQDVFTPGRDVFTPGQDIFAPGRDVFTPGQDVFAPGQDILTPGQDILTRVRQGLQASAARDSLADHDALTGRAPAGGRDAPSGQDALPARAARPARDARPAQGALPRRERAAALERDGEAGGGWPAAGPRPRPRNSGDGAVRGGAPARSPAGRDTPPGRRGPLRGFPPLPGQPDPVYPPGQFSAWNRPSTRASWLGISPAEITGEADAEPGYSVLAVSDPSADATATQTWAAIEDDPGARGWPARRDRDWRSHSGDTGPTPRQHASSSLAAAGPGHAAGTAPATAGPAAAARAPAERRKDSTAADSPARMRAAGTTGQDTQAVAPPARPETAAAGRAAAREQRAAQPTRGKRRQPRQASRPPGAKRGGTRPGKRHTVMMAGLLLSPVVVVALIVAGYIYLKHKHVTPPAPPVAASHPPTPAGSPSPSLGPWQDIESRARDPLPLTLGELFPARFADSGVSGVRTVQRRGSKCSREVFGSKLAAAVRKGACTQVLRASYLSSNKKLMATIGVLNLGNVSAAERVGQASGASEFIKQLPGAHGPTRNLAKGTGLEEAEIKGHYVILTWAEFANLHKPSGKRQVKELKQFSADLVSGTVNLSLTNRMVTGKPKHA